MPSIIKTKKIVLAIDLIGSASSELIQPPEISRKHLSLFNYLKRKNLLNNPPEVHTINIYIYTQTSLF